MQDADQVGQSLVPALDTSHGHQLARPVTDADEEIFLLYTLFAPEPDRRGLGQVDNNSDYLQVTVDLQDVGKLELCSVDIEDMKAKRPSVKSVKSKDIKSSTGTIQVLIRQNSTSLRSTSGDTGSVIWRSSLFLSQKILLDFTEANQGRRRHTSEAAHFLLSPEKLARSRVLELGSGTGILPLLLLSHPYLASSDCKLNWLATDQVDMLPLLRKNLASSPRVHVERLDWVEASTIYHSPSMTLRRSFLEDTFERFKCEEQDLVYADLIVATDCIFNPSLFAPFVDTLNLCSAPLKTIVMVVCELRESEAMTEFLQTWLNVGRNGERWTIFALEGQGVIGQGLIRGSVVWIAWRVC